MKFLDKYADRFSNRSLIFLKILGYLTMIVVSVVLLLNFLGSIVAVALLLLNWVYGIVDTTPALVSIVLVNGSIEPLSDLLPVVGNLDEVVEVLLILWAWPRLIKTIEEFQQPEPVAEELQVEDIEYIDVRAEVLTSPEVEQTEKESTTEHDRTDTGESDEPS